MPEKRPPGYLPLGLDHMRACEAVHTLACCLGELDYLQDGLAQVRAVLKRIDQTGRTATSCLEPQGDQSTESVTTRARDRAILWLLYRQRPIFAEAEAELDIPLWYWANALDAALDGSWDDVVRYLDAATGAHYLHVGDIARPDCGAFDSEETFLALGEAWRDAGHHRGLVLSPRPPDVELEEWMAEVSRIVRAYDQGLGAPSATSRPLYPGKLKGGPLRGQGKRRQSSGGVGAGDRYQRRVMLCNLWYEYPTRYRERDDLWRGRKVVTWSDFVAKVSDHDPHATGLLSPKAIEIATKQALAWGAPAGKVPLGPEPFVLG